MKKDFYYIIVILLLLGLAYLQYSSALGERENREADRERYLTRQAATDAGIRARDSVILRIQSDRKSEAAKYAQNQSVATSEIKALKRRERKTRVDSVILTLTDTIFAEYDSMLIRCNDQMSSQKASYEQEIDSLESNISDWEGKFVESDSIAMVHMNEKKPSNWGLGATAGISTLVHQGQVISGPGASLGITYKIPPIRFRDLFRRK